MMIDKRIINIVIGSKKYIAITVLWNWITLIGGIISAVIFACFLQDAFDRSLTLINTFCYVLVLIVSIFIRAVAVNRSVKASYKASTDVKHRLRTLIFQKIIEMPLNQANQQSTSLIIQTASEGVEQLEVYFGRYLPQLFYSLLAPSTLFIFLLFFNAATAFILFICVPLIPMSIIAVNKMAKKLLSKYWSIYVVLGSSFLDNLQGLITLKIYQDDDYKSKKMDEEAEYFRTITMKVLTMQLNSVSLMDLLAYGGTAVGILTALLQFQNGDLTILGVILFILLSSEFFIPLRLLGSFFHVAMNGKAASDKIFKFLDTPVDKNKQAIRLEVKEEISVEIRDLFFSYLPEQQAIKGLTLNIKAKQFTVFVGESGCGKSTLVSLLMGFNKAQQGQLLFNQQDIQTIGRNSLYRHISLVSHSSYIFKGSLRENMLIANLQATDEQIYHILEKVNLASFVRENHGLDMELSSRGDNLSGGQIQRLALARALLHDADLYIFDEATSNIDVESEEVILDYIQHLKNQKTIIMISHRLANAVSADNIYVLQRGQLVEQGNHYELVKMDGLYAEMFYQQKNLENIIKGASCNA